MLLGMISGVLLVAVFAAVALAGAVVAVRLHRGSRPPAGESPGAQGPAAGPAAGPLSSGGPAHV